MGVLFLVCIVFSLTQNGNGQKIRYMLGCDKRSCYPATGNLLIGRQDKLSTSNACGTQGKERYCIISSLDKHSNKKLEKCAMCDATDPAQSHAVAAIVHKMEPAYASRDQQNLTWWQASNGVENVSITLDLEAEFHVTHVIITFKTFRPAAMYIEKSFDWGKTWTIHRYFSADCQLDFPGVTIGVPNYLNETVCQKRYSKITPSTNGEVIYRVLPPNIKVNSPGFDPYSKEVQDLLKTTNLRLTFTRLFTLGDDNLMDNTEDVMEKYYFSINSMVVRGSCSCYGHASECVWEREEHKDIPGMVHGTCKCEHNTKGNNCEYCKDFYQDWPWRPAFGKKRNECKKCECNDHTDTCHFDDAVFSASGNTSGGVCDNCTHNTDGRNCELCMGGFFQVPEKDLNDAEICAPCDCHAEGTVDEGDCDMFTSAEDETEAGQCHCKTYVGGMRCDRCTAGYWNFTTENPDGCQQCTCNIHGTVQSEDGGCDEKSGACTCKRNVARTRDCDQCLPEHYGLSESEPLGCKACDCDPGGAYNNNCDVNTGQCMCRPNIRGRRCDTVEDFYYTGPLDYLLFEGELATGSAKPLTKVIRKKPSDVPGQTTWTGFGYMQVFEGSTLTFHIPEIWRTMDYFPIIRYEHDPNNPTDWDRVTVELDRMNGPADPMGRCKDAVDTLELSLAAGTQHTGLDEPFCLESGQRYQVKLIFDQWAPNNPTPGAKILIDSIAFVPDINDIPFLNIRDPPPTPLLPPVPELPDPTSPAASCPPLECDGEQISILTESTGSSGFEDGSEGDSGSGDYEDDCWTAKCHPDTREVDSASCIQCPQESDMTTWREEFLDIGLQCDTDSATFAYDLAKYEAVGWMEGVNASIIIMDDGGIISLKTVVDFTQKQLDQIVGFCPNGNTAATICLELVQGENSEMYCKALSECAIQEKEAVCEGDGSEAELGPTTPASWFHPSFLDDISQEPEEPDVSTAGWYPGDEQAQADRDEFDRLGCKEHFLQPKPSRAMEAVPEECMETLKSISFLTFQGAHLRRCDCHSTGSEGSSLCDKYYGGCTCKPLVVGRRCDSCAPASYGFSSSGCVRCECHSEGSQDEFCNQNTGQCTCNTLQPTFGRRCDECTPGYWDFPVCRQCQCNGHAPTCHPKTGDCINCADATMGAFCDKCQIGFYGSPELGPDQVQCRECKCPDTKASGHSFAWQNTCELDENTKTSVCHCEEGYDGNNCDICDNNYFGHPEIPGGNCARCDCSENWIEQEPGNCDHHTGECLKCQFHTEGFNCEECMAGYFGDAVEAQCEECTCDFLGTDSRYALGDDPLTDGFECDRKDGTCHCLPNVQGKFCSDCIENHWKIASGEGCEHCECDPVGSTSESCDVYTGQCDCKVGYGGRRCNECEENMWGDPQIECKPCNCNPMGVDPNNAQCEPATGKCFCLEGIGGEKCDECALGFIHKMAISPDHPVNNRFIPSGQTPNCQPCGECFDNWNRTLAELQANTTQRVREAETVKVTGAAGAYTASFNDMESKIAEVNDIISRSSLKNEELEKFTDSIKSIETELQVTTDRSKGLDNSLAETEQSIMQGNYNLTQLNQDADRLQRQADNIKDKATQLQEANVAGALKLTAAASDKSEEAAQQVTGVSNVLHNSGKVRGATEVLLNGRQQAVADNAESNTANLDQVTNEIRRLEERIPDLNKAVCDGDTSVEEPCDDLCGGAGCGKCGDVSCGEGALTKAQDAVTTAKEAEKILQEKDLMAEEALNSINSVHNKVGQSLQLAEYAYGRADEARNRSQSESDRVDSLTKQIEEFLGGDHATPEQVKAVAQQCLDSEMTMDTNQIKELADQINKATESVKNVEAINQETAQPLALAMSLKSRADSAKELAAAQLARAETVTKSLGEATDAQSVAETAITTALRDIDDARSNLGFIESEMQDATRISDQTFKDTADLMAKQKALQTAYISNENHVKKAQTAAESAKTQASKANSDLYALNSKFKEVSESLTQKEDKIGSAKDQALSLQRRANKLSNSASQKLADLTDMEKQYEDNQQELEELSAKLTNMNCQMQIHLKVIQSKSAWYTSCTPPTTWRHEEECVCQEQQTEPQCSIV